MKRLLLLFIVLISVISSLAAEDSTTDPNYTKAFFLLLNKNGTDQVWFQKEKTTDAADPDANSISINIFPLINAASTPVAKDTVYLYWIKQSSNNVKIKITFVGNESCDSNSSTFMMWSASTKDDASTTENESENKGINFDVTITDSSSNPVTIKTSSNKDKLEWSWTDRHTKQQDTARSFSFKPDEKVKDSEGNDTSAYVYTSPLKIDMTINPAFGSSTAPAWGVDEQYVGYIKATIEAVT